MDDLRPCAGYLRHPDKHQNIAPRILAGWFYAAAGRVCPDSMRHYRFDGYTAARAIEPMCNDDLLVELDRRINMEAPGVSDALLHVSLLNIAREFDSGR